LITFTASASQVDQSEKTSVWIKNFESISYYYAIKNLIII
jgi:hypothetical protein